MTTARWVASVLFLLGVGLGGASGQVYTVTTSVDPSNAGAVSGGGVYTNGSTATVTATANNCHSFGYWSVGGAVVGTSPTYTFTVVSNVNLV
ncbi:MAG TPA: hypothetical protein VMV72_18445, partial [Verrucomicrobiae bacterium]|nr:hypothetical protein [Verrucomicrobiae bacterium]